MAYINEHTAKQNICVTSDHPDDEVEVHVNAVNSKVFTNFQIARKLKEDKTKLVEALSRFPVTALCLINIYELQSDSDSIEIEQDDEGGILSESAAALAEIKRYYFQASHSFSRNAPCFIEDKQHLTDAVQLFPFSFNDLARLVDVIAYVYKFKGLSHKTSISGSNTDSDLISKRLEGIKRRAGLSNSKFFDWIKSSVTCLYDDQFLFLNSSEMHKAFTQVIVAEHRWLSSRERLATANTRLVMFIANQYKGGFLEFDDLVQEGQTGLLKAVDRYDHRLGYKFSTYAGYWIRQAISRALSRGERVVRIPCGQMGVINKVYRAKEQLVSQLGKEPSVKELSEYINLSVDEINTILAISQSAISIEGHPDDEESAFSPIHFLEQQVYTHPFRDIAQSDLENLISKAIDLLNPREAKVICGHFGIQFDHEMTLKEIGNELNLTRERVRQIQVAALNKMRSFYEQQLATCL